MVELPLRIMRAGVHPDRPADVARHAGQELHAAQPGLLSAPDQPFERQRGAD
jgi:hypothetical protein